jgi:hypothetical protein
MAALSGCSNLGGTTNGSAAGPNGPAGGGIELGTVTLTYDLEGRSGTTEFAPSAGISDRANIDVLSGIGFVWGKSVYDKRGVIPALGLPGPAAVVSLAVSNTSSYLILGPYMQFSTTLSGFRVRYPTAPEAAPLGLGDPDTPNGGIGATGVYPPPGWLRWICESDGGLFDTGAVATNWVPMTTDHGWVSGTFGQNPLIAGPGTNEAVDDFITEYDSVAADKTYTIRFLQIDPALGGARTWGPLYDPDGDTDTLDLTPQVDATPPNPIACAIPMRFQQMPGGETPISIRVTATLYADALVDARSIYTGPRNARWDNLKAAIGGYNPAADWITSAARDTTGDVLVGWLDSSAGTIPGVNFMLQASRLSSDLSVENPAVIPIGAGIRTVASPLNVRGFAVSTTRNRLFVAVDTGPGTGTVFTYDATTGLQADGGAGLDVAVQQGIGSFNAACRISSVASDDANDIVYVAYGDGVAAPATVARVIGYGLGGAFVPTTQVCASPAAGFIPFRQDIPELLTGGELAVDATGRVYVSSGINASPNGILRLTRSGANLTYSTVYDIDNLTTVPAIVPANQTYSLFSLDPSGAVCAYIPLNPGGMVPSYDVTYSPDLPGDSGPHIMGAAAMPPAQPGFVHFTAGGVWDSSTWLYLEDGTGATSLLLGGPPTAMLSTGSGPLATQKSALIYEPGAGFGNAQIVFLNM